MRLWFISHRRPAKAQAYLCICAVSPEHSLFAHMKYESRRKVQQNNQTSSATRWLRIRGWRMSLRRTKSAIISWDGLIIPSITRIISLTKIIQRWVVNNGVVLGRTDVQSDDLADRQTDRQKTALFHTSVKAKAWYSQRKMSQKYAQTKRTLYNWYCINNMKFLWKEYRVTK